MVVFNRSARHFYEILETYEAGISLTGSEVKSLREGNVGIKEGFARVENNEVFLYNINISPYTKSRLKNYNPRRKRKLLLHKQEIRKLTGKIKEKGLTLIPLELYFNQRGNAKVLLGLAKGKKIYDKRETLKRKAIQREIERELKGGDRSRQK